MAIRYVTGNILKSKCEALVNPVNTVGVMGAGLAKAFKTNFPKNFGIYKASCDLDLFNIGDLLQVKEDDKLIINFPTKEHYKDPSTEDYIETGLINLRIHIIDRGIKSVALPALGCGLGGLDWIVVKAMIEKELKDLGLLNIDIEVYEPQNLITKRNTEVDKKLQHFLANPPKTNYMTRLEANREIIIKVEDFLEKNPDMRFIQALWALNIIERDRDKFYEESETTLHSLHPNE